MLSLKMSSNKLRIYLKLEKYLDLLIFNNKNKNSTQK